MFKARKQWLVVGSFPTEMILLSDFLQHDLVFISLLWPENVLAVMRCENSEKFNAALLYVSATWIIYMKWNVPMILPENVSPNLME